MDSTLTLKHGAQSACVSTSIAPHVLCGARGVKLSK